MKRRRFLSILMAFLSTTVAGLFAYPLIRFFAPPARDSKEKSITIKKADLSVGEAKEIIVNNKPAIIINRPGKGYLAFSKVCTHLGCLVIYDKAQGRFLCPCHAGTFDLEGNVLSGPPPRPLPMVPLKVEGEFIIIG